MNVSYQEENQENWNNPFGKSEIISNEQHPLVIYTSFDYENIDFFKFRNKEILTC